MKLVHYLTLLRPTQWLKNLILFFPPFLSGMIFQPGTLNKGAIPFISFCLASSFTYVFNDICDKENDSLHPHKMNRPIAAGTIPFKVAILACLLLLTASLLLSVCVSLVFLFLVLSYLIISMIYSLKWKHLPVIDLFCISLGFLLRLKAGGAVFDVVVSEWLFLSVFLLSIFLSTGKRLSEKNLLGEFAGSHRKSLTNYPEGFLDGLMYMAGASVLVTYSMYVIPRHELVYTVPLCFFGLSRYIFRVKTGKDGDPTESLLKDMPLFAVGLFWAIVVGWSIYK